METPRPRLGVMLVGMGGNNGSTLVASMLAHRANLSWINDRGEVKSPNFYGSFVMSATTCVNPMCSPSEELQHDVWFNMLPFADPVNGIVFGGWDINRADMYEAVKRAKVLNWQIAERLKEVLSSIVPLPSIYKPSFIAANQGERANNVLTGSHQQLIDMVRGNIRDFKAVNKLDKVIVLWTANTERMVVEQEGVHDTVKNLVRAIANNHEEISPSMMFAVASILEGCPYLNGSPQNTLVPGIVELARNRKVFISGNDFKTGQTKLKSLLVEYLIGTGIKPRSIASYNHLGNNDGKNLSAEACFKSKEQSKTTVIDDMVAANKVLFPDGVGPDHCVVIKYMPYVDDSKRAMDEYVSEIFMGGENTLVIYNTCEDSLLATPIILDLLLITDMITRKVENHDKGYLLSLFFKAPLADPVRKRVVNAFSVQKDQLEHFLRDVRHQLNKSVE